MQKRSISTLFFNQNLSDITQTPRRAVWKSVSHKYKALMMLKVRQTSVLIVVYFPALLRITNTKKGKDSYLQLDVKMSGSCAASRMASSLVLLAAAVLDQHSLCNRHKRDKLLNIKPFLRVQGLKTVPSHRALLSKTIPLLEPLCSVVNACNRFGPVWPVGQCAVYQWSHDPSL